MILTTTTGIEGKAIVEYKGIVFGEVMAGVNFVKDIVAEKSQVSRARSNSYIKDLNHARSRAIAEMEQRATEIGANAVVGVDIANSVVGIDIDYEVYGSDNGMLMVTASGTAVRYQ